MAEERELDIRAVGLQFVDNDGRVRATIPEMSVKFSGRALIRGLVAPTSIELFGPRVRVVRDSDGTVSIDIGDNSAGEAASVTSLGLIEELLQKPDPDLASGYLTRVAVRSALIEFDDFKRGVRLSAPRADIALLRNSEGISAEGFVVLGEAESAIRADLSAIYRLTTGETQLGLVFSDLLPAAVAEFATELAPLTMLDTRLAGALELSFDAGLELAHISVDVRASAGTVTLDGMFDEPVAFDTGTFRILSGNGFDTVVLESAKLEVGQATILLSGDARHVLDQWDVNLITELRGMPVNSLETYWPPNIRRAAREWMTKNVRDGLVETAVLRVRARIADSDPAAFDVSDFDGEIRFRDAVVHYLRPLPPVRDVFGVTRFDPEVFNIDLGGGTLRDLVADSGSVEILGLDGSQEEYTIKIAVAISGPVDDAFKILDDEPLGFISGFGLDPALTRGSHKTNVVLEFPLVEDVLIDQIAVSAASRMENFGAKSGVFGLPVSDGSLALNVNRDGMEVQGSAVVGGVPLDLMWSESFEKDGDVQTRYNVRTNLDDAARLELGLDGIPFISGLTGVSLAYDIDWNGNATGAAELNLTNTEIDLDPFGWSKPPGVEGRAFVSFVTQDEVLTDMPEISVRAGDLEVDGAGLFRAGADGPELQRITLERVKFGETDAFVNIDLPDGVSRIISVGGSRLDLRPVVAKLLKNEEEGDEAEDAMQIVISEQSPVGEIRLGEETILRGAFGSFYNDGRTWNDVELHGELSNGARIFLHVEPHENARNLTFESDDAGGVLSALDWFEHIEGGEMRVLGRITGSGADEVIDGQLDMQGFLLTDSPLGAKILALTSFSGIADVLGGEGLSVRRVEVPFTVTGTEIKVSESKARGANIGVLASGRINRETESIEMTGEIAPAYILNSLLANIPVIGTVLSGGGDGIFVATFEVNGPIEDPEVSVNPLSVLTPGIIRRLLTGFGSEGSAPSDEMEEARPSPPIVGE